MARTEARIFTSIWDDPSFRSLSGGAQRLYMLLISQPDLAQDGVIALRERRWASMSASEDTVAIDSALGELEVARYVVVDPDAGELLVRSFIRRDGLYRQPNLLLAARRHLPLVTSARIRAVIASELQRILDTADDLTDRTKPLVVGMLEDLADPTGNPSENPSEKATRSTRGEGSVVTAVRNGFSPLPSPELPPPSSPTSLRSVEPSRAAARSTERTRADVEFDRFWAAYPRRVAKRAARKAWDKAILRADPDVILVAAQAFRGAPGLEPKFTPHPSTWLNGDRWLDERPPPGTIAIRDGPRRSTTDDRVQQALALADELRQEAQP